MGSGRAARGVVEITGRQGYTRTALKVARRSPERRSSPNRSPLGGRATSTRTRQRPPGAGVEAGGLENGLRFTQHRRLDRLRSLLSLNPGGVSLYELASSLDVDPRTVRRYLKELERQCDLAPLNPRGGGPRLWRIHPREIPRKVEMRRTQMFALLAARRVFDPLEGSALFDEIELLMGRLASYADRPGRGPNAGLGNVQLEQRFVHLPRRSGADTAKCMELDQLFQAVSELRPLELRYRSPDGRESAAHAAREERLRIHPYALVLYDDAVYCVARDLQTDQIRTLALRGMLETEVDLEERFTLPDAFRVEEHFRGELGCLEPRTPQRVVIELSASAAQDVAHRKLHPSQRLSSLAGGAARLRLDLDDPLTLVSRIMSWGDQARVVEPTALARMVRRQLEAALAQYRARRPRR